MSLTSYTLFCAIAGFACALYQEEVNTPLNQGKGWIWLAALAGPVGALLSLYMLSKALGDREHKLRKAVNSEILEMKLEAIRDERLQRAQESIDKL